MHDPTCWLKPEPPPPPPTLGDVIARQKVIEEHLCKLLDVMIEQTKKLNHIHEVINHIGRTSDPSEGEWWKNGSNPYDDEGDEP